MKGVLGYTEDKVVATDFRGEPCTSVFDAEAGIALDKTFVKVVAWYDNEWGYSNKVLEMVRVIAKLIGAPRPAGFTRPASAGIFVAGPTQTGCKASHRLFTCGCRAASTLPPHETGERPSSRPWPGPGQHRRAGCRRRRGHRAV
jgi:hypothetical protein